MYAHLLLVVDDGEFYGPQAGGEARGGGPGGAPFSLGQCRAIVTSLNRCVPTCRVVAVGGPCVRATISFQLCCLL